MLFIVLYFLLLARSPDAARRTFDRLRLYGLGLLRFPMKQGVALIAQDCQVHRLFGALVFIRSVMHL